MELSDLFFGTDVVNRTGRNNIRGDELAALINAQGASPQIGKGALVDASGGFLVPIAAGADVPFDTVEYDDLGFFSLGAPTLFTIPDVTPAIQRCYFSIVAAMTPLATGDLYATQLLKTPFLTPVGAPQNISGPVSVITGKTVSIAGGPIVVAAGDSFSVRLSHNSGTANFASKINFAIWVAR